MSSTRKIMAECKAIFMEHYGECFAGLYLYGSAARDQDDSASDVDLLVLLAEPFDYFKERAISLTCFITSSSNPIVLFPQSRS